jgi:cytochrome c-type biogenesis protein CcmE
MAAVGGIIVIVVILALAVVSGSTSATVASVDQVASGEMEGKKVEVSGTVVDNSYDIDADGVLTFDIYDPEGDEAIVAHISYDKGVSSTFGNGVVAICTGRMDGGVLVASELVTKCPSKYENAQDALTVERLLGYGESMLGKTTKVTGLVRAGSLADVTSDTRFVIEDDAGNSLPIHFEGALSDEVTDGVSVVIMGALDEDGTFLATDVALEA